MYFKESFKTYIENFTISEMVFGMGTGTHGQEARLLQDKERLASNQVNRIGGDSGITKLLVELGIFGFLAFVAMYALMLSSLRQCLLTLRRHRSYCVALSLFFIPVGWAILFVKAHTVISDGMVSFGLWFSVGFILAIKHYVVKGQFPGFCGGTEVHGSSRPLLDSNHVSATVHQFLK